MEEIKELYRVNNFVVELHTYAENLSDIIIKDVADTWNWQIGSASPLFRYWVELLKEVNAPERFDEDMVRGAKAAIEATFSLVHVLSTIGLHDVELTNELCDAVDKRNERYRELMDGQSDAAKEEADAEAWMEREATMEEMKAEIDENEKE